MPSIHPKTQLPLPINGTRADIDDFHIPPDSLRSTSYNWLFRNGKLVTRPGLTALGQAVGGGASVPLAIISYFDNSDTYRLVQAHNDRWYAFNDSTSQWDDISDVANLWIGGTFDQPATFRVFNSGGTSHLLGARKNNTPRTWGSDPLTDFAVFGGNPPIASCMAIVADRVVLGNLLNQPTTVDVSEFQDHNSGWGATQTAVLVDTPGEIVSMNELGANQTAIYKSDAVYLATGRTGIDPLRFDLHSAFVPGPITLNAVVQLSTRLHIMLTRDGEVYTFDGTSYVRHPSSSRIRTLLDIDISRFPVAWADIHGHYNAFHNEVWWFYNQDQLHLDRPRAAVVLNLTNGSAWKETWTHSAMSFTASFYGDYATAFERRSVVFLGDTTGQVFRFEGDDDNGADISHVMESGLSDLGDPTRVKTLVESEHYFDNPTATQNPSVAILYSEAGAPPETSASRPLTLTPSGTGPYQVGHEVSGGGRVTSRFMGVQILDALADAPIQYQGSSLTIVARGSR